MARRKEIKKLTSEERQEKQEAILAALANASSNGDLLNDYSKDQTGELLDYYTLSRDEIEALVNGDMVKIETWAKNLDKDHAAKLLRWLIKEKW